MAHDSLGTSQNPTVGNFRRGPETNRVVLISRANILKPVERFLRNLPLASDLNKLEAVG